MNIIGFEGQFPQPKLPFTWGTAAIQINEDTVLNPVTKRRIDMNEFWLLFKIGSITHVQHEHPIPQTGWDDVILVTALKENVYNYSPSIFIAELIIKELFALELEGKLLGRCHQNGVWTFAAFPTKKAFDAWAKPLAKEINSMAIVLDSKVCDW